MESRFGVGFGEVRLHSGSAPEAAARAINARAFTVGRDIVFDRGENRTDTREGRRLLAHELVHVVQQSDPDIPHGTDGAVSARVGTDHDPHAASERRSSAAPGVVQAGTPGSVDVMQRVRTTRLQLQEGGVTTEEFDLAQQRADYHRLVGHWYDRYDSNLETNARHARSASERFIDFEEGGINQLRTTGSLTGSVIGLFGGPAAVVGLCVTVLTEVAAQELSSAAAKKAAAVRALEAKEREAKSTLETRRTRLDDRIDSMTSAFDHRGWGRIANRIANYGVPEVVSENVIYRDLLLQLARGGGYNISGSQWNVENMALFGDAPWYHSWDWGSPGWTNGQDIAEELNSLAEGDPSTRIDVSINPP